MCQKCLAVSAGFQSNDQLITCWSSTFPESRASIPVSRHWERARFQDNPSCITLMSSRTPSSNPRNVHCSSIPPLPSYPLLRFGNTYLCVCDRAYYSSLQKRIQNCRRYALSHNTASRCLTGRKGLERWIKKLTWRVLKIKGQKFLLM